MKPVCCQIPFQADSAWPLAAAFGTNPAQKLLWNYEIEVSWHFPRKVEPDYCRSPLQAAAAWPLTAAFETNPAQKGLQNLSDRRWAGTAQGSGAWLPPNAIASSCCLTIASTFGNNSTQKKAMWSEVSWNRPRRVEPEEPRPFAFLYGCSHLLINEHADIITHKENITLQHDHGETMQANRVHKE